MDQHNYDPDNQPPETSPVAPGATLSSRRQLKVTKSKPIPASLNARLASIRKLIQDVDEDLQGLPRPFETPDPGFSVSKSDNRVAATLKATDNIVATKIHPGSTYAIPTDVQTLIEIFEQQKLQPATALSPAQLLASRDQENRPQAPRHLHASPGPFSFQSLIPKKRQYWPATLPGRYKGMLPSDSESSPSPEPSLPTKRFHQELAQDRSPTPVQRGFVPHPAQQKARSAKDLHRLSTNSIHARSQAGNARALSATVAPRFTLNARDSYHSGGKLLHDHDQINDQSANPSRLSRAKQVNDFASNRRRSAPQRVISFPDHELSDPEQDHDWPDQDPFREESHQPPSRGFSLDLDPDWNDDHSRLTASERDQFDRSMQDAYRNTAHHTAQDAVTSNQQHSTLNGKRKRGRPIRSEQPEALLMVLFVPFGAGSFANGQYRDLDELPQDTAEQIIESYNQLCQKDPKHYEGMLLSKSHETHIKSQKCVGQRLFGRGNAMKFAGGNEKRSCNTCTSAGRLCVRLDRLANRRSTVLVIYPRPTVEFGTTWGDIKYWL
ncbi:hypothetical protein BDV96DRAFT_651533 [Lophiotrema nucula]|uniref:Uncharacterized protein n=1 Tax=Lophiotrema nucula TaxID=690887 RepID=A0A6A5YTW5_9PLEO|nr:hypothetical protein BDV96DRAFT_651533 [Lophiotrema nucula]